MLDVGETPSAHVTWSTLATFNSSIDVLDLAINPLTGDLFGLVAYSASDAQVWLCSALLRALQCHSVTTLDAYGL